MVAQPQEEQQELFAAHPEHASDAGKLEAPAGLDAKPEDEAAQFDVDKAPKVSAVRAVVRCCSPCVLYTAGLGAFLLLCSAVPFLTGVLLVLVAFFFGEADLAAAPSAAAALVSSPAEPSPSTD